MAQIPVLHHNQISGKPHFYRKKEIVKRLIRKGLLEWVVFNELARMVSPEQIRAEMLASKVLRTPWEPVEIPGLHFEEPNIKHNPDAAVVRRFNRSHSYVHSESSGLEQPVKLASEA